MLGKLLKYDMRALSRFLLVIHGLLIIGVVLGRLLITGRMSELESVSQIESVAIGLGIVAIMILMIVAALGTEIYIAVYYYKNLFSDEGYLTHTLPVTKGQLLASKTIAGSFWIFIDQVLLVGSFAILLAVPELLKALTENKAVIFSTMGIPMDMTYGKILWFLILISLISGFTSCASVYLCVTLGQLFGSHRVLGAVVIYFCITTVMGLLSGTLMAVKGITSSIEASVYTYYQEVLFWTMAGSLVISILFYLITLIVMKKKINLI